MTSRVRVIRTPGSVGALGGNPQSDPARRPPKKVAKFSSIASFQPGEIMFNAAFADCVSDSPPGDLVLRGGHVGRYFFNRDPNQGEPKYLNKRRYLETRGGA